MGMYTKLELKVNLSPGMPSQVYRLLRYRLSPGKSMDDIKEIEHEEGKTSAHNILPVHDFFRTDRWDNIISWYGDKSYRNGSSYLTREYNNLILVIKSDVKNYDGLIDKFLDWLSPYLLDYHEQIVGFVRYEEWSWPALIKVNPESKKMEIAVEPYLWSEGIPEEHIDDIINIEYELNKV